MDQFLARLLDYYSLTEEEYERFYLPSSFSLPTLDRNDYNVKKAMSRLSEAKEKEEKVLIYGDYDCDGIMSASIMNMTLKRMGIKCDTYIPSRYIDGYGLTEKNIPRIHASGFKVILCVDNGVTAYRAIEAANEFGMDVLIIDHHEFGDGEIKSHAYLHPTSLNYGKTPISAGYLSYIFSTLLLGYSDDYLLVLGAISTISDMMPLKEYNHHIVKMALDLINKNRYKPIVSLTEKRIIDENVISYEIVSKINAVGRIDKSPKINRLPKYFSLSDSDDNSGYIHWLNEINDERKKMTKDTVSDIEIDASKDAIVKLLDIPSGLNGLVANRLMIEFDRPVAIFSRSEVDSSILVGSIRSKEGFNVLEALKGSHVDFLACGGHEFAGGASIKEEDFPIFEKDFLFAAMKHRFSASKPKTIPLSIDECTEENFNIIRTLAPFGHDFPSPKFLLSGMNTDELTYTKNGKYLRTKLKTGAILLSFSINEDSFALSGPILLDVQFSKEEYKGKFSINLIASRHIN